MNNKKNSSLSLRKVLLSALVAAPLAVPAPLWALPATQSDLNANIVSATSGVNATVVSATQTTISTTATNSVIKWSNFGGADAAHMSIGTGDLLLFQLPSNNAAVLNIVTSTGAGFSSQITGAIQSNGSFYLLNPNGIVLATGGTITSTGGAVGLSTINESEFPFLANGALTYVGTSTAGVTVQTGATITAASGSGNVFVAGKSVDLAGTIDGGALTVTAQNGNATLGSGGALTIGDTTAYASSLTVNVAGAGNNVVVGTGANNVTLNGNSAKFTLGGGNVSQGTGSFKLGDSQNDTTLTISGAGDVNLTGVNPNGKALKATVTSATITSLKGTGGSTSVTATTTGNANISTSTGDLTFNASTIGGNLVLNAAGELKSGGTSTVTGTVDLTSGASKKLTYSATGDLNLNSVSAGSDISITSTTGSVALPTISAPGKLAVTAATDISNKGANTITAANDATFDAGNSISLTNANDFAGVILKRAPSGASVTDANGFILKDGTSTTGNVTLTSNAAAAGNIAIGGASGDKIAVAGNLTITTNGNNVTQGSDNTTVLGNVNITAGAGSITLGGATNNGVNLKNQYGQITIVSGASATLFEATTLNLGNITLTGALKAYSATGIIQTGTLSVNGLTVGAGTSAAPADITLTGANNVIAGTITVLDDVSLLAALNPPVGSPVGNYLAHTLTLVNNGNTTIGALSNTYGTGLTGDLNVTATSGTSSITLGNTVVSGKVILNAPGNVSATGTNSVSNYTVTSGGAVDVRSSTDVTFNASLTGSSNANFQSGNTAIIGAVTSGSSGTVTFKSGNKKDIKDSVAGINIYGPVTFNSANGVSVTKSGHSFGPISIVTANNASATVVESGTLNLASANINVKGSLSLTSTNGDIIQSGAGGISLGNGAGTATFSARSGKVTLNGGTGTNDFFTGAVSITAQNDSVLTAKNNDILLGNITVGSGGLTVTNGTADKAISQKSGTTIYTYGTTSFTTSGAASPSTSGITITNSGNQFGGLVLTSGNGDISITEKTTMNLKSVSTTGKFTATSEGGSIIDSVDATVANNKIVVNTSAASFSAPNGNITLALSGSQYGTVSLNTGGNASIVSYGPGDLKLGLSTIGGTLDVMNTASGFNITQVDALNVGGNTTFTTSSGGIDLQNTMNQFGALRFVAGNAGVKIFEATTLNLRGGSVSSGPVVLSTNGDFVTSGTGGSTFTGDLTISALGTIKPSAGSLYVVGTFTVFSNNAKDLSQLSKTGNLTGKDPVNLGSGAYSAPAQ